MNISGDKTNYKENAAMSRCIGKEELKLLEKVIYSEKLWKEEGTFVRKFEREFGEHIGTKYVIAVNSGSTALEAAVAACDIGPGDEVICTPYSFIASSMCVLRLNGVPVFADIDPRTLCLDPDEIAKKITKRTKAIIIVHIYGQPAQMDKIMKLAKKHKLYVIEDACQAYDSLYKGKKVGTIGDIGVFSLQQAKQITAGEGGIVVTNNEELFRKASMFSNIGMIWDWEPPEKGMVHFTVGGNYRMGELQGAVALAQLRKLNRFNKKRQRFLDAIESGLKDVKGIELAYRYKGTKPNYYFYPFRYRKNQLGISRTEFLKRCAKKLRGKIKDGVSGDTICISYIQPVFREKGLCPRLEHFAEKPDLLTIRMHQSRSVREIKTIVDAIKKVVSEREIAL